MSSQFVWLVAALALLAAAQEPPPEDLPPADCPGCASTTWQCERQCRYDWNFGYDFTWQHGEGSCDEVIPRNSSAMQFDWDLWCAEPAAFMYCRTDQTGERCMQPFTPLIGCDNMQSVRVDGLSLLDGCDLDPKNDLVRETCDWACKHNRPVFRCMLHFDGDGRYGMTGNMEKCWLHSNCEDGITSMAKATCKPEQALVVAPKSASIAISTAMVLSVADANSLSSDTAKNAMKEAIAASLDGVTAYMVQINGLSPADASDGRRLASSSAALRRLQQAVRVAYTIVTESNDAAVIQSAVDALDAATLASAITSSFAAANIAGSVTVTAQETSEVRLASSAEVLALQDQLAASIAFNRTLEQILTEALEDLNATKNQLANAGTEYNTTVEELEAIKALHQAAQDQLAEVIEKHSQSQNLLQAVRAKQNLTQDLLAASQAREIVSAQRLQTAEGRLNETAALLVSAQQNEADLQAQLDAASPEKRAELEAMHNQALEELANAEAAHEMTKRLALEAEADHNATLTQLTAALEENSAAQGELQRLRASQDDQDQELMRVTRLLNSVRSELWRSNTQNNATGESLARALDLVEILRRREADLRAQWARANETMNQKTQEDEEPSPTRAVLWLLLIGALIIVLALIVAVCVLFCRRRWEPKPGFNVGDGSVVVGRPVPAQVQNEVMDDDAKKPSA
mmetsp:Transcript_62100/g.134804  ORF Transcript_62100/g.134804 Transcript_62100/m.134804 type:complete len:689 (+) Transcript_62100:41-2107(+)